MRRVFAKTEKQPYVTAIPLLPRQNAARPIRAASRSLCVAMTSMNIRRRSRTESPE
jgi:hypothetical protein